jgi:hypothetical protein
MNESGLTDSSGAVTAVEVLYIHPSPTSKAAAWALIVNQLTPSRVQPSGR